MKIADNLVYQCPHCHAVMEIEPQLVGEHVTCVNCQKPFEAAASQSVPIAESPAAKSRRTEHHPVVDAPADEERELQTLHPAMFRNHPFWYTFLILMLACGLTGVGLVFARQANMDLSALEIPDSPLLEGNILLWTRNVLIVVSAVAYLIWRVKTWFITLRITSERTIYQQGLIARSTSEVRHDDVRNLQIDQSLLERLLDVGSIAISSAGQDDCEIRAHGIPDPSGIVEAIRMRQ